MKKTELLCPQCKDRIPLIEKIFLSELKTPMIKLKCLCSAMKNNNSLDLDDYLSFLDRNTSRMPFCFKHDDQKAHIFCKDCSLHMCNLCFSYHMSFNPLHQIQTSDSSSRKAKNMCLIHITRNMDYYCEDCNQNICFECIRLNHINHIVLQLQEYWNKTDKKIEKWKNINFDQFISQQLNSFTEVVQIFNEKISTLIFNLQQVKTKLEHGIKQVCETNIMISAFIKIIFDDFYSNESTPNFEIIQNVDKIEYEELLSMKEENIFMNILNRVEEDIQNISQLGKGFLNKSIINVKNIKQNEINYNNTDIDETPSSLVLYAQQQQLKQIEFDNKISLSLTNNLFINNQNSHHNLLKQLNCISQYCNNDNNTNKIFNKEDILKTLNIVPSNNSNTELRDLYLNKKRFEQNNNKVEIEKCVKQTKQNKKITIKKKKIFSIILDQTKRFKKEHKIVQQMKAQLEKTSKKYLLTSTSDDYFRTQTQSNLQLNSGNNEYETIPNLNSDDNYNKLIFHTQINEKNLNDGNNSFNENYTFKKPQESYDYTVFNKYEQCFFTIKEHSKCINTMIQLKDGRLVSGEENGVIHFFDPNENYLCKMKINTPNGEITCIIELFDRNIAVGFQTSEITIYSILTSNCDKTFIGHTKKITSMAQKDPNTLISSSEDFTIKIWDVLSVTCLMTLQEHQNTVNDILISSNNLIISASGDLTLKLWNFLESPSIFTFKGHIDSINKIIQLPKNNSNLIISASNDKSLKVWDILTKKCISTLIGHNYKITSVIYLIEGAIASVSIDSCIKIWNIQFMNCTKTLIVNQKISLMIQLFNGLIATVTEDNLIKLWF